METADLKLPSLHNCALKFPHILSDDRKAVEMVTSSDQMCPH